MNRLQKNLQIHTFNSQNPKERDRLVHAVPHARLIVL